MSDVFISYARSTEGEARRIAEALRALGYGVWRDDELPAHRAYAEVIEERLRTAKAVVVVWSAEAAKSEWVQSEADRARADRKLVQLSIDGAPLPMPFDRIQCADLSGWTGDAEAKGWKKVIASVAELLGSALAAPIGEPPLPLPTKPSIAVMPFANLSGDPEQEYFADGMVEEITNALTRIKLIFVIAGGTGLSFKGKATSPKEAAQRLGVRYVLEGSVRKSGGRVRIAVRLVDGSDGTQLWADHFEDTLDDVFALQDRVALAVAGRIEPTVQQAEIRRVEDHPTNNIGSHDLYLRALPFFRGYTKSSVLDALLLLERAIALDPNNGPALGLAALCHSQIVSYGWSANPEPNRHEGVELAHRALKAAPDDAYVLSISAAVATYLEGDIDTGVTLADRAIGLSPGSALARMSGGMVRVRTGQVDLASEHLEAAIRLDPLGPDRPAYTAIMCVVRFCQRRFAGAVALGREAAQQNDSPLIRAYLAASYGHLGRSAEALDALADFRSRVHRPIEDFTVFSSSLDPDLVRLFLDGIALADGKDAGPPAG